MENVNLPGSFSGYLPVGLRILILCTGAGTRVGSSRGREVLAENGGKLESNRRIQNLLGIWEANHNISYITVEIDLCQQFFK
jgi:hypothetical protein